MSVQTNLKEIPLTKLVAWAGNVRKTGVETGLDELTASIAAHGLLNPLTVTQGPKGKFAVVAGQRRLLALKRLAKDGTLNKNSLIACTLRGAEGDPTEWSLAENTVRVAMHPADQFEAWRTLIDNGQTTADVALRFGVAESTVRKRMALARVSPRLFALFREGVMGLEALQAFTVSDDHDLQLSVWMNLQYWERDCASTIRRAMTKGEVPTGDLRVRFVGLEAYEAAGGVIRRDLFDGEGGGFCQDIALLDRLVREKLERVADGVKAEGWAWTEARPSFERADRQSFDQADMGRREPTEAEAAEIARLTEQYEALGDDEWEDEQAISEQLDAIDEGRTVWTDSVMANAGAVIFLGFDGLEIKRGLIRPEDAEPVEPHSGEEQAGDERAKQPPRFSAALMEDLTANKTAALQAELAHTPCVALALVTHALLLSAFYQVPQGVLKLGLVCRNLRPSIRDHGACKALATLEVKRAQLLDQLPDDPDRLLAWCFAALQDELLEALAVASAHGLDAVTGKGGPDGRIVAESEALAEAVFLDMERWYVPTASGYFGRISKDAILGDLAEARGAPCAPSWHKMKKSDLAKLAEREVADIDWLPAPLD